MELMSMFTATETDRDRRRYHLRPDEEVFTGIDEGDTEDSLSLGYELRDILIASGEVDGTPRDRYQVFLWRSLYEHAWPVREIGRRGQPTGRVVMIGKLFPNLLP